MKQILNRLMGKFVINAMSVDEDIIFWCSGLYRVPGSYEMAALKRMVFHNNLKISKKKYQQILIIFDQVRPKTTN